MANYVLDYSGSQINTKLGNATTTSSGVMSAEDKIKLNGIENGANKTLIDDTLTEEGQVAEAKATGDAILDLKSDVDDLQDITGNGALSGFTATDLTGAANELKNTLNSKYEKLSSGIPDSDIASAATWNSKANAPTALSLTLASGSWSSATPPTQSLSATGVTASNIIVVGFGSGITSEQYNAASAAKLACTAQKAGTITMTAFGVKPTVNIPISVVVFS